MQASIPENRYDQPFKAVNYVECHDNHTMWDKNRVICFEEPRSSRMKKQVLSLAMVLLAQGTPFIHCGQEFGRTKHNLGNTYNRSDYFNMIDYHRRNDFEVVVEQFKVLTRIRREHSSFRLNTAEKILTNVSTETIEDKVLVYRTRDEHESLVSFFNPTDQCFSYNLNQNAKVLFDSDLLNPPITNSIKIPPLSVIVVQLF